MASLTSVQEDALFHGQQPCSSPEPRRRLSCLCVQVIIIVRGVESIRVVEQYSAPILLALAAALLAWALSAAGGVGPMLSSPSQVGPRRPSRSWNDAFMPLGAVGGLWGIRSRAHEGT